MFEIERCILLFFRRGKSEIADWVALHSALPVHFTLFTNFDLSRIFHYWYNIFHSTFLLNSSSSVSETCASTTTQCSRLCMSPEGTCLPNGNCLCKEGFTGPKAIWHSGSTTQVQASHCLNTCGVRNPHQECVPASGCDARCQIHLGHECIRTGE